MRAIALRAKRGKLVHCTPESVGLAGSIGKTLCGRKFATGSWFLEEGPMTCLKCLNKLLKIRGGIKQEG